MTRLRDESGFVGGFEALPFGFLVFLAGSLLLVNAWAVFDCHTAASAGAREAVRAFVEAGGTDGTARQAGEAAALEAIEGHGKDPNRMRLSWDGARLARCQAVTVTVAYAVPSVAVPWIGAFGSSGITTTASHSEIVDPYRSGLAVKDFDPGACGA